MWGQWARGGCAPASPDGAVASLAPCALPYRSTRGPPPVRYVIEVVLIGYQWTVCRRYTEFLRMHEQLKASYPAILSRLAFPERTLLQMSKRVVDDRRVTLQTYIVTLANVSVPPTSREEEWQGLLRCRVLDDFLEVARHVCGPGASLFPPGLSAPDSTPWGGDPGSPPASEATCRQRDIDSELAFPATLPRKCRPLFDMVLKGSDAGAATREARPVLRFLQQCQGRSRCVCVVV